jgi:uncharacterized lipoprotein YddW (UPF0748 family)
MRYGPRLATAFLLTLLPSGALTDAAEPEVRGTWLTTTANTHIATPSDTAATMRRLREIGLNTVYVEAWKNGYTQFPSTALAQVIGVDRRPNLMPQDPSETNPQPPRDLLQEAVIEAHRNGMLCIAWFEYGFMAAHKDTQNHLRRMYPQWLSRDIEGNEVAPNGFVWMNPLHPRTRRLLMDIVLEAVDRYDLDGVQLDDRIVWPYYTMGYDDYTVAAYRNEHGGMAPPEDPRDPEWMRWRIAKVNEFSRQFVAELRARRPGLIVSLSPAPYPWCLENYLLEWPKWAKWRPGNRKWPNAEQRGRGPGVWWDEFIPQCYRYDYDGFAATWRQQIDNLTEAGARSRTRDLLAGILTTGSKPDPVPWPDLEQAVQLVRDTGGGGHVWWFSRGVLDEYPAQITALYDVASDGAAPHPARPVGWRPPSVELQRRTGGPILGHWTARDRLAEGRYRLIGHDGSRWSVLAVVEVDAATVVEVERARPFSPDEVERAELLVDRRLEMSRPILP